MKAVLILIFGLFFGACGATGGAMDNQAQKYGEKVSYASGREIKFSNFSLRFVGKREVGYPNADSPRKMTFYDFEIAKGDAKQTVSWSSGTGDIAPTVFDFGGASYVLELGQSDIKGALGEGNLIVWKKADYDETLRSKTEL